MTTHFMEEAEYLCDRVCLMVKGKIAAIGKIADLVEQARLGQKIEFSSKNADCKTLGAIAGVSKAVRERDTFYVYGNGKNFLRAVVVYMADNDIDFYDLSCSKSGLSDVFFKLTGFGLEAGAEAAAAGTPSLKLEGTK
jgi:ABC-2 type transport system ATP-binding protein